MTWWRPDSAYDLARPRLAATGKVMGTAYTRDELDAAHEDGRTTVVRTGARGAVAEVEITRDDVVAMARRWLEGQGLEDSTVGGWFSELAENVASTQAVQATGRLVGAGSVDQAPDGSRPGDDLALWVKVGVGVVVVVAVAWGLASVASIARSVRG